MNESSFGLGPEGDLRELKFRPLLGFCNVSTLFLIFSPIANAIYDFFLGWRILCFHLLIKSTLFAGKELLRLDNKQNNTWSLVNSEFLFSCPTGRLTSECSELSAHS